MITVGMLVHRHTCRQNTLKYKIKINKISKVLLFSYFKIILPLNLTLEKCNHLECIPPPWVLTNSFRFNQQVPMKIAGNIHWISVLSGLFFPISIWLCADLPINKPFLSLLSPPPFAFMAQFLKVSVCPGCFCFSIGIWPTACYCLPSRKYFQPFSG